MYQLLYEWHDIKRTYADGPVSVHIPIALQQAANTRGHPCPTVLEIAPAKIDEFFKSQVTSVVESVLSALKFVKKSKFLTHTQPRLVLMGSFFQSDYVKDELLEVFDADTVSIFILDQVTPAVLRGVLCAGLNLSLSRPIRTTRLYGIKHVRPFKVESRDAPYAAVEMEGVLHSEALDVLVLANQNIQAGLTTCRTFAVHPSSSPSLPQPLCFEIYSAPSIFAARMTDSEVRVEARVCLEAEHLHALPCCPPLLGATVTFTFANRRMQASIHSQGSDGAMHVLAHIPVPCHT